MKDFLELFVWVFLFFFIFHKTKVIKIIFEGLQVNYNARIMLLLFILLDLILAFIVLVVLPLNGYSDYEDYSRKLTPISTISFFFTGILMTVTIWPSFKIFSLVIVPVLFLGLIVLLNFIPLRNLSHSICSFIVILSLIFLSIIFH